MTKTRLPALSAWSTKIIIDLLKQKPDVADKETDIAR